MPDEPSSPSSTTTTTTTSTLATTPAPTRTEADRALQYQQFKHNVSLALLFICPAIAVLPPRKLDFYTFSVGGAWVLSANHLFQERRRRQHLLSLSTSSNTHGTHDDNPTTFLPALPTSRARDVQQALWARKAQALRDAGESEAAIEQQLRRRQDEQRGVLHRVWMGGENNDWYRRRLRDEQQALDEGKGYADLIMEQVREVFGGKREEEDESKNEGEEGKGQREREEDGGKGG